MKDNIPASIRAIMTQRGFNKVYTINQDGKIYYSFARVDKNGQKIPIGKPFVYCINGKTPVRLSYDEYKDILAKKSDE